MLRGRRKDVCFRSDHRARNYGSHRGWRQGLVWSVSQLIVTQAALHHSRNDTPKGWNFKKSATLRKQLQSFEGDSRFSPDNEMLRQKAGRPHNKCICESRERLSFSIVIHIVEWQMVFLSNQMWNGSFLKCNDISLQRLYSQIISCWSFYMIINSEEICSICPEKKKKPTQKALWHNLFQFSCMKRDIIPPRLEWHLK